jgi:DNA-binding Xre family transcriptional regulator
MPPRRKSSHPQRQVTVRIDALLAEHKKSLYWLAQISKIPYATLRRLRTEESESITLNAIAGICRALDCTPNDLFALNTNPYLVNAKIVAASRGRKGNTTKSRR